MMTMAMVLERVVNAKETFHKDGNGKQSVGRRVM